MPSSLVALALAPLMLFGANPPRAPGTDGTIWVSLCFGEEKVPLRVPHDEDRRSGAVACHGAAVLPKKKRLG